MNVIQIIIKRVNNPSNYLPLHNNPLIELTVIGKYTITKCTIIKIFVVQCHKHFPYKVEYKILHTKQNDGSGKVSTIWNCWSDFVKKKKK